MMDWFKLPDGNVVGFDDPAQAPQGAEPCTEAEAMQIVGTPVIMLDQAQRNQVLMLRAACQTSITAGFTSNALGAAYIYPSDPDSQSNQRGAAIAGASLWCEQGAVWALHQHTAAQAAQVVSDFMLWVNKCQTKLAMLIGQVNKANQTVTGVQGVAWSDPT